MNERGIFPVIGLLAIIGVILIIVLGIAQITGIIQGLILTVVGGALIWGVLTGSIQEKFTAPVLVGAVALILFANFGVIASGFGFSVVGVSNPNFIETGHRAEFVTPQKIQFQWGGQGFDGALSSKEVFDKVVFRWGGFKGDWSSRQKTTVKVNLFNSSKEVTVLEAVGSIDDPAGDLKKDLDFVLMKESDSVVKIERDGQLIKTVLLSNPKVRFSFSDSGGAGSGRTFVNILNFTAASKKPEDAPFCGDGVCNTNENILTCTSDCPVNVLSPKPPSDELPLTEQQLNNDLFEFNPLLIGLVVFVVLGGGALLFLKNKRKGR